MRKFFFFLFLFTTTLAYSIPSKRVSKLITVDGQQVKVTLQGNESAHYWVSADGVKYMEKADGSYAVMPAAMYQKALSSNKFAVNPSKAPAYTKLNAKQARAKRKAMYQGERRGLVILVNFSDNKFTGTSNPKQYYTDVTSAINYKGSKNYGSVRDYFRAQSYGKFDFVLDVAGPYTLSHNISYYGANDSEGEDMRPGTMVWDACKAADADIDFSKYDWDGDGVVEQVFVVYAGYGEAQGASANTVWPHAWSLSEAKNWETGIGSCKFDGVTVNSYACSSELASSSGTTIDGIGTICHEFSHCFGLPDLYCTDPTKSHFTMDTWSLMDYGNYANDGYTPVSFNAYERWFCGWLEPQELKQPQFVKSMTNIDDEGEAYIIYNDANENEYYLLQNIQKSGWNAYAGGHGMLVLHVNYNDSQWHDNTLNNYANSLGLTPICADNIRNDISLAGDTYPGTKKNTALTDTSTPAATLFNANTDGQKLMHKPITDIAESSDGLISFTFMGGFTVETPKELTATIADNQIKASWIEPAENVVSYNIKYGTLGDSTLVETVVIDEDFAKFYVDKDKSTDISASLDSYLTTAGFTGTKLYQGAQGMKVGSSKVDGELITPTLQSTSGKIRLIIESTKYNTDNGTIFINAYSASSATPFYVSEPIYAGKAADITISDAPSKYKIALVFEKRSYLNRFKIIDNAFNLYNNETLLTGVTSTPYAFTPSIAANEYWMQIQTVGPDGKTSEWSDIIIVKEGSTALNSITPHCPSTTTPLYNLKGQQVNANFKGIIISNGRKVVRK